MMSSVLAERGTTLHHRRNLDAASRQRGEVAENDQTGTAENRPGSPIIATIDTRGTSLALEERQQVGIDRVRLRSRHAVRKVPVGFQDSVLQQLRGQRPGGGSVC